MVAPAESTRPGLPHDTQPGRPVGPTEPACLRRPYGPLQRSRHVGPRPRRLGRGYHPSALPGLAVRAATGSWVLPILRSTSPRPRGTIEAVPRRRRLLFLSHAAVVVGLVAA